MEEIALIFSSLAGACTAVAIGKVPKIKHNNQTPTINSAISDQLHSLRMEKEVLSKTITRLHQKESDITTIQKDKLLLRYQHQLGIVTVKIEKLEAVSKYPDLGPVGDSLISLMDKRLSHLDQRLNEISSKITIKTNTGAIQVETPSEILSEKAQPKIIETKLESQKDKFEIQKDKTENQKDRIETHKERTQELIPQIEVPTFEKHRTVELSTLTEITNRIPKFPAEFIRPYQGEPQSPQKVIEPIIEEPIMIPQLSMQGEKEEILSELPKNELILEEPEKKIKIPTAIKIPEEEKLDDDDKDLDKIKSEIMKALSKLEQVEVE